MGRGGDTSWGKVMMRWNNDASGGKVGDGGEVVMQVGHGSDGARRLCKRLKGGDGDRVATKARLRCGGVAV